MSDIRTAYMDQFGPADLADMKAEHEAEMQRRAKASEPTPRRAKAPEGECPLCDRERAAGNSFHPPHDPSRYCESGKHNHCSCDTCF